MIQQDDVKFVWVDLTSLAIDLFSALSIDDNFDFVRVYRYRQSKLHYKDFQMLPEGVDRPSYEALRKFILLATFTGPIPSVARELSTENARRVFLYSLPVLILFRNTSEPNFHELDALYGAETSQSLSDHILTLIADVNSDIAQKFATLVEADDVAQYPTLRILDPNPGRSNVVHYAYNQPALTGEGMRAFLKDYIKGRLTPYRKSEANPSNRAPGLVTPLNAETFDAFVMDKTQDVFVLFYTSNYCNLCEELWPLYIQAAKAL
jgi:thiol-disulfide isomerase/thioredoxin